LNEEIIPAKYQEASIRFREVWLDYVDKEEQAKYEIVNMIKILEAEGFTRTRAIEKIVEDHNDLKGFSKRTIYREIPEEMKNKQLGRPNMSNDILVQPNNNNNYEQLIEQETTKTLPTAYEVKDAESTIGEAVDDVYGIEDEVEEEPNENNVIYDPSYVKGLEERIQELEKTLTVEATWEGKDQDYPFIIKVDVPNKKVKSIELDKNKMKGTSKRK
jgi:hypothetical protein